MRNISDTAAAWKTIAASKVTTFTVLVDSQFWWVYFDENHGNLQAYNGLNTVAVRLPYANIQKLSNPSMFVNGAQRDRLSIVYQVNKANNTVVLDPFNNLGVLQQFTYDCKFTSVSTYALDAALNGAAKVLNLGGGASGVGWSQVFNDPIQNVSDYVLYQRGDQVDVLALVGNELVHYPFRGSSFAGVGGVVAKNVSSIQLTGNPTVLELFVVGKDKQVILASLDDDTVWEKQLLFFEKPGNAVTEFSSYCTEITVGDANGVPLTDQKVYFKPNEADMMVDVNGRVYMVDAEDPYLTLVTNSAGKVNFTVNATSLVTPQIVVWGDFTQGQQVLIEPNANQQNTLATVDQASLAGAKKQNPNGTPGGNLFSKPNLVGADFVTSLHTSMELTENGAQAPTAQDSFLGFAQASPGVYVVPSGTAGVHARIQEKAAANKHFEIGFHDKGVSFIPHTADSAKSRMVQMKASAAAANAVTTYDGNLADIFQGSVNGAITLQSIVVTGTSPSGERGFFEGLTALVNFVMDGINYVIDATLQFIHEAFAMVESLFAQVSVYFKDLFAWLGSFFSWDDILNTKEVIKHFISDGLVNFPLQMNSMKTQWNTLVDGLFDRKDAALSAASAYNQESLNQGVAQSNSARTQGTPQDNWVLAKSADHGSQATLSQPVTPTGAFNAAMDAYTGAPGVAQLVADAVASAVGAVGAALEAQQGDVSLQTILASVVPTLTDQLQAAVKAVGGSGFDLAGAALGFLNTLLTYRINLPIVTPLYETVISKGSTFTLLDFISLAAAIPTTLAYKLLSGGKAPVVKKGAAFDPSCQAEVTTFTSQSYKNTTLFQPGAQGATRSTSDEVASVILSRLLGGAFSVFGTFRGVFDFLYHITPKALSGGGAPGVPADFIPNPAAVSLGIAVQVFSVLAQLVSIPSYFWEPNTQPWTPRRVELWIWCGQWGIVASSLAMFVSDVKGKSYGSGAGVAVHSVLGLAHLMSFMVLYNLEGMEAEDNQESRSLDSKLKMAQNVLTAVGEAVEPILAQTVMDRMPPTPVSIGTTAVYELLFHAAPAIINFTRVLMNWSQQTKHYNL